MIFRVELLIYQRVPQIYLLLRSTSDLLPWFFTNSSAPLWFTWSVYRLLCLKLKLVGLEAKWIRGVITFTAKITSGSTHLRKLWQMSSELWLNDRFWIDVPYITFGSTLNLAYIYVCKYINIYIYIHGIPFSQYQNGYVCLSIYPSIYPSIYLCVYIYIIYTYLQGEPNDRPPTSDLWNLSRWIRSIAWLIHGFQLGNLWFGDWHRSLGKL